MVRRGNAILIAVMGKGSRQGPFEGFTFNGKRPVEIRFEGSRMVAKRNCGAFDLYFFFLFRICFLRTRYSAKTRTGGVNWTSVAGFLIGIVTYNFHK